MLITKTKLACSKIKSFPDTPIPSDRGIFSDHNVSQQSSQNNDYYYDNLSGANEDYDSLYGDDVEPGSDVTKEDEPFLKYGSPQRDVNGNYLVDDMIIPADLYEGRIELSGRSGEKYRWENQVVPYKITGELSKINVSHI